MHDDCILSPKKAVRMLDDSYSGRIVNSSHRRHARSFFPGRRPIRLCLLLALPVMGVVMVLKTMDRFDGEYLLLSASTEQWLADAAAGFGSGQQTTTQTSQQDPAFEREMIRRRVIRERVQQRQEQEKTLKVDGNVSNATIPSTAAGAVGPLPLVPTSGKFDWHLLPIRNAYSLTDPILYSNETMIVIVLSARANFERRAVIRETWGRKHALYFVVGAPSALSEDESIQARLLVEQEQHSDLLDSLHPDMYSSLPYKLRYAYQWVTSRLPLVEWIVKVDDDTVVRVDTLQNAFLRSFNPNIPVVVGRIIERSPVAQEGKWKELDYQESHYPFWPQGSCGHVVSRVVARYIASMEPRSFTYYQGEDVSIGIWLDQAPADKLEPVTWIHSKYFSNDGQCLKHAWLIMGHDISAEHMRACHQAKDEWPVEELTHKHWNYWAVDTLKWTKGQ